MNTRFVLSLAAVAALASSANAAFDITINFAGGTSPAAQTYYNNAATTWENVITGYKPGVTLGGLTINASFANLGAGVLGQAGPTAFTTQVGTTYTTAGSMQFSTASYGAGGSNVDADFADVVLHEMGHILGIGTLWTTNNLTNTAGNYVGPNGLLAYNTEFAQVGTSVPVEAGGGGGTAGAHWNEVDGGGVNTGITSLYTGIDFRYELMTGWADSPTFLSSLTRFGMVDLGYTVNPIPEPTSLALLSLGALALRRRTR